MKISIITLALLSLFFASCTNSNGHDHDADGNHVDTENVHVHEDGSVHVDHEEGEHKQEAFKVKTDSTAKNTDDHSHSDGGHSH